MPLFAFVLLCAEIAVLIKFAQAVGGAPVLLEILVTAGLGILFLRMAGRSVFEPARLIELLTRFPTRNRIQSLGLLLLGGILLVIPGLLSDVVGLLLVARFFLRGGRTPRPSQQESDTIDIEFEVRDSQRK